MDKVRQLLHYHQSSMVMQTQKPNEIYTHSDRKKLSGVLRPLDFIGNEKSGIITGWPTHLKITVHPLQNIWGIL